MRNKLIAGLFVLLLHCQCTNQMNELNRDGSDIHTYDACLPDVSDKYKYPIVPGMEEWNNLESVDEAIKACQLPDDVLKNISTAGLIHSLLDIPMLSSSYYTSSQLSSINRMNGIYPRYNSAQELFSREDAGKALLAYYDAICFDCIERQSEIDLMVEADQVSEAKKRMDLSVRLAAMAVCFTQQHILDQLDDQDTRNAVSVLLSKYKQVQQLNIEGFHDPAALEVIAYVMYYAKYEPVVEYLGAEQQQFDVTADKVKDIISFAEQYIR